MLTAGLIKFMYAYIVKMMFALSLFINALLFLPQTIKVIKLKSSENISIVTFIGFLAIQLVCVLYGFLVEDWILALGFMLGMVACVTVVIAAIYYRVCASKNNKS
ncbi:PQ-loop domain-containing transporter [Cysteiniphilum sp. 6C5]|uniref:PQ-loop domain-containing transporter n=1 Tax=unclassified Cysteiniphilum TaxID=2610889 RepID=UPI003F8752CB